MGMGTMTTEPRPLDVLRAQVEEAWYELIDARVDWNHSPNAHTVRAKDYAESRFDKALERLWAGMTVRQQAAVRRRPVRVLAAA